MIKRSIRFKEWGVFVDTVKTPSDAYMKGTDGSLEQMDYPLRTDSRGFILTGNNLPDEGQRRKIVTLGGSFVESLFTLEQDRFQSRLERSLAQNGHKLSVWNAGYSGSTLLHCFNLFVNKIIPLLPYVEYVFIFACMSDQRILTNKQSYWLMDKTHAPVLDERNGNLAADREATSKEGAQLLDVFIDLIREFGSKPVVISCPHRIANYDSDAFSRSAFSTHADQLRALENLKLINQTAMEVSAKKGVEVFDAAGHFEGRSNLFYDMNHLNSLGQVELANFLYENIVRLQDASRSS